jgi:hypothetical protein
MYSKIYPIVISSILAFAVFAGIPKVFENIAAQEDGTSITQGGDMNKVNQSQGNDSEMVQDQSNIAKNDGNNEEEEGDDE